MSRSPHSRWNAFFALAGGVAAVALMVWERQRFFGDGVYLHPPEILPLLIWAPMLLVYRRLTRQRDALVADPMTPHPADPVPAVLFGLMLLALIVTIPRHPWYYLHQWFSDDLKRSGLVRFALLSALLYPLMLTRRRLAPWLLAALIVAQLACAAALLHTTQGAALYRDDHPSFMFRLHEFVRVFPSRVNYNPWWNAGVVDAVGTSSGIVAPALMLWPLWRAYPIHEIYTPALAVLFIGILPWLSVLALRAIRAGWTAAACAGLLALGVSRYYFVWALHFGTIGAAFTVGFLPPVIALSYRLFVLGRKDWLSRLGFVFCAFMLVQWPPGALMAAPLALSLVLNRRTWRRHTWHTFLWCGIPLGLLLLPAILTVVHGSDLLSFTLDSPTDPSESPHGGISLLRLATTLRRTLGVRLLETHPIIVFMGLAGVWVLPWRHPRRWLWPPILFLALTAAWGPLLLPNMQLERMAIPMVFAALIPAACWVGRLLHGHRPSMALPRAATLALLLMGAYSVRQIYTNRGYARYSVAPPMIERLVSWIDTHVPPEGRVLFAGSTVHFYGHGHVAYLPVLTGREMMACDYYHFPTTMVEYEYPPHAWRGSAETVEHFFDLHGVTHILSFRNNWIEAFRAHAEGFIEHQDFADDGFYIFERRAPASRFVKGQGSISADFDQIVVRLDDPHAEALIAYNWMDGLWAEAPVEIFPVEVELGATFIGIRPNGRRDVTVRFRSRL